MNQYMERVIWVRLFGLNHHLGMGDHSRNPSWMSVFLLEEAREDGPMVG